MDQQQARLWLAIVLSMVVWFAYDHFVLGPARERQVSEQTPVAEPTPGTLPEPKARAERPSESAPEPDTGPGAPLEPVAGEGLRAAPSGTPIRVSTPLYQAVVTPKGGRLLSFELNHYRRSVDPESPRLDLVSSEPGSILPLTVWIGSGLQDGAIEYQTSQTGFDLSAGDKASVSLEARDPDGRRIEKTIGFDGDSYLISVSIRVAEGSSASSMGLVIPKLPDTGGYSRSGDQAVAISAGKLVEHGVESIKKEAASADDVGWAGFSGTYFASVAIPEAGSASAVFGSDADDPIVRVDTPLRDGATSYTMMLGPKDRDLLEGYGHELDRLVDLGWFWFIASPLLWLLHHIYDFVGNYGIAIIVVTILLKAITFPLNQTSMKSMRKMQEIQPQMQRLRERHKDDPAAMQREMMDLYKKHKVNPLSGCLPMVLQIPIFIGLYNGLLRDIGLRHAPFVGWINDLSAPDRLHAAGIGIPVLTLLMGASMLLQQVMMPAQGDPNQRRMMMIMPVVFTFMFINFPSGLVLYWLVNNVISIGQQYLAMRPSA